MFNHLMEGTPEYEHADRRKRWLFDMFEMIAPFEVFNVGFSLNGNGTLVVRFEAFIEPKFWPEKNQVVGILRLDGSPEHFRIVKEQLEKAVEAYKRQQASENNDHQRVMAVLEKLSAEDREVLGFSQASIEAIRT